MLNGNGTAYAQTMTPVSPLFVTWFFGNGSLPGKWKPAKTGTGANWDLSPQLQPLAALKSVSHGDQRSHEQPRRRRQRAPDRVLRGDDRRGAERKRREARLDRSGRGRPHLGGRSVQVARGRGDAGDAERRRRTRWPPSRTRGRTRRTCRSTIPRRCSPGCSRAARPPRCRTRRRSWPTCARACSTPCWRTARTCRRSSAPADKQRVEQHLQSIRDIEARLVTTTPTTPTDDVHQPDRADHRARTPRARRLRR